MEFKLPGTTNEDEDMIDDKMFIYEAFGLILGSDKMDSNLRISIIKVTKTNSTISNLLENFTTFNFTY